MLRSRIIKLFDIGEIRTHDPFQDGALNHRLKPLGHAVRTAFMRLRYWESQCFIR